MSADKDRGIRRQKQKRAKQQKKDAKQAFGSSETKGAATGSSRPSAT